MRVPSAKPRSSITKTRIWRPDGEAHCAAIGITASTKNAPIRMCWGVMVLVVFVLALA